MPDDVLESALRIRGLTKVAGVDEAGRGPLAGSGVGRRGAPACPGGAARASTIRKS
jgi:hypothetical protein